MEHEIRSVKGELRAAPGFKLQGMAARYGVRSANLGGFVETIAPGAFSRSLAAGDKVVVTKNHDPNFVLGSTKAGTATVEEGPSGLRFSVQLDPANTMHKDTYASVKRGDLDSCSFAFTVPPGGDDWAAGDKDENGTPCQLRTLRDVNLIDCSVVTYPAYPVGTQVDARSLESRGLLRVASRTASRKTTTSFTEAELARAAGLTVEQMRAADLRARRSVLNVMGAKIATDQYRDLKARAERCRKIIEADAELQKKENELRARMENAAGVVFGRRSKADDDDTDDDTDETSDREFNSIQAEMNDVLPGHKLLGYSSTQAFSLHIDSGTKWSTDYTTNATGQVSLGRTTMGGHPSVFKGISLGDL